LPICIYPNSFFNILYGVITFFTYASDGVSYILGIEANDLA